MHAFTVTGREIKAGDLVNVPWSPSLSSLAFGSLSAIRGALNSKALLADGHRRSRPVAQALGR